MIFGDRDATDQFDVFRCLAAADGQEKWTVQYPAPGKLDYGNTPRTTPLIHKSLVYLQGAFGDLHCLDAVTGTIKWSKNFQRDFGATKDLPWGTCGSPLIADGKLIINPGAEDASVVALDPQSGAELWSTPGHAPAYGSFLVGTFGGVRQVVGHDEVSLGGWAVEDGRRLWTLTPPKNDDFNVPTPVALGNRLLVTSENNGTRLYAFDGSGRIHNKPIAVNEEFAADVTTPTVVGGRVFGLWNDLFCLDANQGLRTVWTYADPSFHVHGTIIGSNDRLLVTGASGDLLLVDATADPCRIVARLQVFDYGNAELYSHPAIVGQHLYVRGEDEIVCIDLAP